MRYTELFKQTLKEYSIEKVKKGSSEIPVVVNPNKEQILNWVNNSKYKILRGYHSNGNFYIWDAYDMNHDEMVPRLGLEFDSDNIFHLNYVDDKNIWLQKVGDSIPESFLNNPYIQKLFNKTFMPNVLLLKITG